MPDNLLSLEDILKDLERDRHTDPDAALIYPMIQTLITEVGGVEKWQYYENLMLKHPAAGLAFIAILKIGIVLVLSKKSNPTQIGHDLALLLLNEYTEEKLLSAKTQIMQKIDTELTNGATTADLLDSAVERLVDGTKIPPSAILDLIGINPTNFLSEKDFK